jgi:hypothetical protein
MLKDKLDSIMGELFALAFIALFLIPYLLGALGIATITGWWTFRDWTIIEYIDLTVGIIWLIVLLVVWIQGIRNDII